MPFARGLLFLLAGATLLACTNFHVLEEGRLYRSGQPEGPQLTRWIWRYGIETVVRLRGGGPGDPDYQASHGPTVATGIDFVHVPLSAVRFPERQALLRLCDVFDHARYPILLHCRAGADRTGMVSAIYVLHRTGDLDAARGQLVLLPYGHLGWFGMDKADLVLDMYEPWHGRMTFCEWAREIYERPEDDELPFDYVARQREAVSRWEPPVLRQPSR